MQAQINRTHLQVFSHLLDRLEENGVLDRAVAVFTSDVATGSHRFDNIPWVIAGSGDGALARGQYVDAGGVTHNLLLNTLLTATIGPKTARRSTISAMSPSRAAWWMSCSPDMFLLFLAATAVFAADEPDLDALEAQMGAAYAARDFEAAADAAQAMLDQHRKTLGPRHADVAFSLRNLGQILVDLRDWDRARLALDECIEILNGTTGPRSGEMAEALNAMGRFFRYRGEYAEARRVYTESLEISREIHGSGRLELTGLMKDLAMVQFRMGDYPGSRSLFAEIVDIERDAYGPRGIERADSLSSFGQLLKEGGEYEAARRALEEAVGLAREFLENDDPSLALALNNLGLLLHAQGDYAGARPLLTESLEVLRQGAGRPKNIANNLNNLAILVRSQGDYQAALPLFEEALEITREALGPTHHQYGDQLANVAAVHLTLHNPEAAIPLLVESLAITREALGPRHANIAHALSNLATAHLALGARDEAQRLHLEALDIRRDALGPNHPAVAASLYSLGNLSERAQSYEEARALHEESLEIRREALGARHVLVASSQQQLASVLKKLGDVDGSRAMRNEALEIFEERLALLDALSEREAIRFVTSERDKLDNWLHDFDRPDDATAGWGHVLRFKGALAAKARAARALAAVEPDVAEVAGALDEVRRDLASLAFAEAKSNAREARDERMVELANEQERLERDLLSRSAKHRRSSAVEQASPASLCEVLPPDSALIDIFRYSADGEPRYLAYVLRDTDCKVHRVDLGNAEAVDSAAVAWVGSLKVPQTDSKRARRRGLEVSEQLLGPLDAVAGDSGHWLVVPDGRLAGIPFGALPTVGGYLVEDHLITYLDRANDVLPRDPVSGRGAVVVGGVDYDAANQTEGDTRTFLAPCNGGDFVALPGTASETERLGALWKRWRRRDPLVALVGGHATEGAVAAALENRALAHIATHGFFATGDCKSALDDGVGYDPMLLTGLALAGANRPPGVSVPEDGILTASEVMTRDLSNTQLVVLSACETGRGEMQSGQGVLGLRRAFAVAGAHALIMSLWAVPDDATAKLMHDLYRRHLGRKSVPAAEALRMAQLQILAEQRRAGDDQPHAWAAFIASGDWRR